MSKGALGWVGEVRLMSLCALREEHSRRLGITVSPLFSQEVGWDDVEAWRSSILGICPNSADLLFCFMVCLFLTLECES